MRKLCFIVITTLIMSLLACSFQSNEPTRSKSNLETRNRIESTDISSKLDKLNEEAKLYIEKGDYSKAKANLINVIISSPNSKEAEEGKEILENMAKSIIRVHSIYSGKPNSVGGTDLHIIWTNMSNKTIKYISFFVVPYNAVNDVVSCNIRGTSEVKGQITGPIESSVKYGKNIKWECAWYNNTINKVVLTQILIDYMDGTSILLEDLSSYGIKENQIDSVIY